MVWWKAAIKDEEWEGISCKSKLCECVQAEDPLSKTKLVKLICIFLSNLAEITCLNNHNLFGTVPKFAPIQF